MEFTLLFNSVMSSEKWAEYIHFLFVRNLNIDMNFQEEKNTFEMWCKYFSFSIDKDMSEEKELTKEAYEFDATINIYIQMIVKEHEEGMKLLFKMLKIIMEERKESCLLQAIEAGFFILKYELGEIWTGVPEDYGYKYPFTVFKVPIKRKKAKNNTLNYGLRRKYDTRKNKKRYHMYTKRNDNDT